MKDHLADFDTEADMEERSIKSGIKVIFGLIVFYCGLFAIQILLDFPSRWFATWIVGVLIVYSLRYAYLMWKLSKL